MRLLTLAELVEQFNVPEEFVLRAVAADRLPALRVGPGPDGLRFNALHVSMALADLEDLPLLDEPGEDAE